MVRESIIWAGLTVIITVFALWGTFGRAFTQGKPAPEISGGPWVNSSPLTIDDLKGDVVLLEFWSYG